MTKEYRMSRTDCSLETRDDGQKVLHGYAAVWYRDGDPGTEYELWKGAKERIERGAFKRAIKEKQDVLGLFNHDVGQVLGRSPKTVRLAEDNTGLRYEIDLPNTQLGRDLEQLISRGDITGSSFGFSAKGVRWEEHGDIEIRFITDVDLYDVSPVTIPAYTATEAAVRSVRAERAAELEKVLAGKSEQEAIQIRMRILDLRGDLA